MSIFSDDHSQIIKTFEHSADCPCCQHRRQEASNPGRRRLFGRGFVMATAGLILPQQWAQAATRSARVLRLRNPHTGEIITNAYWTPDYGYVSESIAEISSFFRDFRQDLVKEVDVHLLNILHYIQTNTNNRELELLSGYRSPTTNAMLRSKSKNVGKNSYHMKAMAADISVKGYSGRQLAGIARQLQGGGIGTGSTFVHVDSANVREWKY